MIKIVFLFLFITVVLCEKNACGGTKKIYQIIGDPCYPGDFAPCTTGIVVCLNEESVTCKANCFPSSSSSIQSSDFCDSCGANSICLKEEKRCICQQVNNTICIPSKNEDSPYSLLYVSEEVRGEFLSSPPISVSGDYVAKHPIEPGTNGYDCTCQSPKKTESMFYEEKFGDDCEWGDSSYVHDYYHQHYYRASHIHDSAMGLVAILFFSLALWFLFSKRPHSPPLPPSPSFPPPSSLPPLPPSLPPPLQQQQTPFAIQSTEFGVFFAGNTPETKHRWKIPNSQ